MHAHQHSNFGNLKGEIAMKKFVSLFMFAFGFILIAPVALATCVSGCDYVAPTPTSSPMTFNVGGTAMFNGFGGAVFEGEEGFAMVEKHGYSGIDIKLDAGGDLCGLDCTSGSWNFSGYAGEHVKASAGALSTTSGTAATAINQGGAFSSITLDINKVQ
jgi:hypothetical protein